ncbi:MAG TPA: hypothetical protein VFT42_03300, partial [Solirubrobacteraceae bacterium]|nr:hypothetical protein [Solirubrobacteraceae bacterium]
MSATSSTVPARPARARVHPPPAPARPVRALAGEQIAVAAGQLGAGVGNLAFSLVAARLLMPGAFAHLASFLALYLLVHVPAASLSAGSALTPAFARSARRPVLRAGLGAGAVVAVASVPLSSLLHLPLGMLLALAAAAPTAGLIALDRGRLYGIGAARRAAASLGIEPVVRLTIGVALGALLGPVGAAAGVVLAGWAALAVARAPHAADAGEGRARFAVPLLRGGTGLTILAFLGLAIVQN